MEESQQLHPSPVRHNYSGASQHKLLKDYSHDGSGHLADSGYTSYQSFNASCSVARSVLATIEEDNEADSSFEEPASARKAVPGGSILTPTTAASVDLISNFHLSTSAKRKLASFRKKLYSDGDVDNLENDCKKLDQEDISPIFHNKRRRNSVIDDFIRSSTPKTAGVKSNFHLETQENLKPANRKPLVLRKFQSFSPSKLNSYRKRDTILQEKSVLANRKAPLLRQNAIQLTTPKKSSTEASLELSFEPTPEVANPAPAIGFSALLDAPILPQTSDDNLKVDLNEEVSQLPSFDDCSFTPTKPSCSKTSSLSHDSVLRDAPASNRRSIPSILHIESPTLFSPTIQKTPTSANKSRKLKRLTSRNLSSTKKDKTPKTQKPTSPKHRSQPVIPGTYRRYYDGIERLNILKRLNEHDKDALEIVLGYLADSDLVRVVAVSRGWRSIIESDRRLNRRLREYLAREAHTKENLDRSASVDKSLLKVCAGEVGKAPSVPVPSSVTRQPFSLCNSIDGNHSVVNTTAVHKSPPVSPSRRKFHENQKIASHLKKSERLKPCPRCGKPSRVVTNKITARMALGSTTKAANRTATVAARLEKSYTLPDAHAVIHAQPSPPPSPPPASTPVTSSSPPDSTDRIRRNLFSTSVMFPSRSYSVDTPVAATPAQVRRSSSEATPLPEQRSGRGGHPQQRRRLSSTSGEESQCDYAVCSGKGCGFTFCVKCLCEHHPDAVCRDLAPNSPSKEDAPVQYVACSKQSRRSLLRLCK